MRLPKILPEVSEIKIIADILLFTKCILCHDCYFFGIKNIFNDYREIEDNKKCKTIQFKVGI